MNPAPTTPQQRQRLAEQQALEREAADHLSRVHGALGLHAAVLALLLPAGAPHALEEAWKAETAHVDGSTALRAHVERLSPAARLPWLEQMLARLRGQPLAARQALLEATRRVMAAGGAVRPLDRLHWLLMRQRLGEANAQPPRAAARVELERLPEGDVLALARYCAFLSRIVPGDPALAAANPRAAAPAGSVPPNVAWYGAVMAPWAGRVAIPPREPPPDADALVHALQELQMLPWMLRPVLLRAWVGAALLHSPAGRLGDAAADALRLSGALLDSPLPPELERHYDAAVQAMPR